MSFLVSHACNAEGWTAPPVRNVSLRFAAAAPALKG